MSHDPNERENNKTRFHLNNIFHPDTRGDSVRLPVEVISIAKNTGCRIFESRKLSFQMSPESIQLPYALLITSEGKQLLKSNPGLLNRLDKVLHNFNGLSVLETDEAEFFRQKANNVAMQLTDTCSLAPLARGGESRVYTLSTLTGDYVVKVRNLFNNTTDIQQPYFIEAAQTLAARNALTKQLSDIGVVIETPIVAPGQVAIYKKVQGKPSNSVTDIDAKLYAAWLQLTQFINEQKQSSNLERSIWHNTSPDLYNPISAGFKFNNTLYTSPDNTVHLIDTFSAENPGFIPQKHIPRFAGVANNEHAQQESAIRALEHYKIARSKIATIRSLAALGKKQNLVWKAKAVGIPKQLAEPMDVYELANAITQKYLSESNVEFVLY